LRFSLQLSPDFGDGRLDKSAPPTDLAVGPVAMGAQEASRERTPVAQSERCAMGGIEDEGQGVKVLVGRNLQHGHRDGLEALLPSGGISVEAIHQHVLITTMDDLKRRPVLVDGLQLLDVLWVDARNPWLKPWIDRDRF